MFLYRSNKFLIRELDENNQKLMKENEKLKEEKEAIQKELFQFIDLHNYYHQYFIHKEHIYYPVPLDVDAYADGCGKAMKCVRCGAIVGSDDGFCRKCGVKLKYV
jgi:hypothetical protein